MTQQSSQDDAGTSVFGEYVKRLRISRGLSRIALARLASVSTRTIAALEDRGSIPRFDAIVRIARTLEQPARDLLRLAGIDVTDQQIERVLERHQAVKTSQTFRSLKPIEYFDALDEQITPSKPALMCILIMTRMSLRGEDIRERTRKLLINGMRVALFVPYPIEVIPSIDPVLRGYYAQTFGHATTLARELRDMIPDRPTSQISIFRPLRDRVMMVQPPPPMNEIRPIMTRLFSEELYCLEDQLSFFVRFTDGRADRWILVNPEDQLGEEGQRAEESFNLWFTYFSEVLDGWQISHEVSDDVIPRKLRNWELHES